MSDTHRTGNGHRGEGAPIAPSFQPMQTEKRPPCQASCPNCGDIRGWIGIVGQREKMGLSAEQAFERAWRVIVDMNPFPSTLGRICPHPCEDHCNRSEFDEPLAINAMERFLGDHAIEAGYELQRLTRADSDRSVGVVGAGPSGLSFAYQMARRGYAVTVYESRQKAGGMLRYGVPDYRLPPEILDAEIERIFDLGVDLRLDTRVGRDIALDELRNSHSAIYLGMGAQLGRRLGIPGEDGASVWSGANYLAAVNEGEPPDIGSRAVIVGGGNAAMDAARTARRAGADVTVLYRRSFEEMPAIRAEIDEAREEGVEFELLAAPVRIDRNSDGDLLGITACRMELGEPDESGRRRPQPVPDSEFSVPADSIIVAVAQSPVIDGFEALDHDGLRFRLHADGSVAEDVFAGGDLMGIGIAGNAVVQGRLAAERLHTQLSGEDGQRPTVDDRPDISVERIQFETRPDMPAAKTPRLPPARRLASQSAEVAGTITEQAFLNEVERCYSCGSCMGCERCTMFCTPGCFSRLAEVGPGTYFTINLDACESCGKCIEVCPCGFLDVRDS